MPTFWGDTVPAGPPPDDARRYNHQGTPEHLVYLNMYEERPSCGSDNAPANTADLACSLGDPAYFSDSGYPCSGEADCKEQLREAMQEFWIDYNITWVTERPADGPYEMAVVGGSYGGGILGIAPLDCGDANGNSVSYDFSDSAAFGGWTTLVTTISQEYAHALGLCHNSNSSSFMYPAAGGGYQGWECGSQADSCYCDTGGGGYDPYCPSEYVEDLLGPAIVDETPPTVEIVSPMNGDTVPRDFTVQVSAEDDNMVSEVDLLWNGESVGTESAPNEETGFYEWEGNDIATGQHELCAVARDAAYPEPNESVEDCVTVTVSDVDCIAGDDCCGANCCMPLPEEECEDRGGFGDPCVDGSDCLSSFCYAPGDAPDEGVCSRECAPTDECLSAPDCQPGWSCEPAQGTSLCVEFALPGDMGYPCSADSPCAGDGQRCASRGGDEGFCTPECDPSADDACGGGGWRCVAAGDTHICERTWCGGGAGGASGTISGGCAIVPRGGARGGAGGARGSAGPAALAVLLAGFALARARRRSRSRG